LLAEVKSWLRHALGARNDASLKEVLEDAIEEHQEQASEQLAPEEKLMLHNILRFSEIHVSDIMIPRTDIVAVPSDISLPELKAHMIEQRHTRVPVYKETLDQVLGFIHIKDMMPMIAGDQPYDLQKVLRNLLFVPPSMRIMDLLIRMRQAGSHMVIVVDEYGGTDGLVTMENVVEEIVGDIQDEHDDDEPDDEAIVRVNVDAVEVSARISIETLEKELGLNLVTEERADEFDTLGGLIFFQLGRVPAKGESITTISGVRFEIIDADPRRIHRVRIITAG
jgi:CBS domain containing-hemolysin-like protein